ncbi:MAG: hypothetical protein RI909_208, partial [Bacteroidota bacterium]
MNKIIPETPQMMPPAKMETMVTSALILSRL